MDLATYLPAILMLVIITNIVTQVLKGVLYDKIPLNLLAIIVSFIVTGAASFVYVSIEEIQVYAWMIVAAIGIAFAVAFAAMYGFDKLKELVNQWAELYKKDKE